MKKVKNDQGKFEFHEIPGTEKVWPDRYPASPGRDPGAPGSAGL